MHEPPTSNDPGSPPEAESKANAARKSNVSDAMICLVAAVGFTVIGIITDALRDHVTTESLTNNSLDLISPYMVMVGLFLFVVALIKLIQADRFSSR